jgi:hypothetical protein
MQLKINFGKNMMQNRFAVVLLFFIPCTLAMEKKMDVNFAHVTLEGLNNFASEYCLMKLTDSSYATLRKRLKELRISKKSDELIATEFYEAEDIKESYVIKKMLILINMRMRGIDSRCLPYYMLNIRNIHQSELSRYNNCTFAVIEGD